MAEQPLVEVRVVLAQQLAAGAGAVGGGRGGGTWDGGRPAADPTSAANYRDAIRRMQDDIGRKRDAARADGLPGGAVEDRKVKAGLPDVQSPETIKGLASKTYDGTKDAAKDAALALATAVPGGVAALVTLQVASAIAKVVEGLGPALGAVLQEFLSGVEIFGLHPFADMDFAGLGRAFSAGISPITSSIRAIPSVAGAASEVYGRAAIGAPIDVGRIVARHYGVARQQDQLDTQLQARLDEDVARQLTQMLLGSAPHIKAAAERAPRAHGARGWDIQDSYLPPGAPRAQR